MEKSNIDISGVTLPAIVTSGDSAIPKLRFVRVAETFSVKYCGKLPNGFLMELAAVYLSANGKSASIIRHLNRVFVDLCEFSVEGGLRSLSYINSVNVQDFLGFLKRKYTGKIWREYFSAFRKCLSDILPEVVCPQTKRSSNHTVGHSPYAFESMLMALRQGIDRIRAKLGRFDKDAEKGRILTFKDLESSIQKDLFSHGKLTSEKLKRLTVDLERKDLTSKEIKRLAKECGLDVSTIYKYTRRLKAGVAIGTKAEPASFTKEDLIATIRHYLPQWPFVGGCYYLKPYRVYQEPRGVLLWEFVNKLEAEKFADIHQGIVVQDTSKSLTSQINPAEYLLYGVYRNTYGALTKYLKLLVPSWAELIEQYFPTYYDMVCVLLYWACLTGWNFETIRSVSVHGLGFVSDTKNLLEMFRSNHIVISGYKRRGQKEGDKKEYNHVTDKTDPYGLYSVLSLMFELSKPLRCFLKGDEQNCIIVCIGKRNGRENKDDYHNLGMFGPTKSCITDPLRPSKNSKLFFTRHEIYEDEARAVRIENTNSMKIRATYDTMLTHIGVPVYVRRLFMGHSKMDTTMTSYGSELVSINIRMKRLRDILDQLTDKAFKGELLRYEQAKKPKPGNNIIQLFTHMENPVFVCKNRTNPTWLGYEKYVESGICDHFTECLFCKQCIVTEESLPHLIRWKKEIREWEKEAPDDKSMVVMMYLVVIEEVLDLCSNGGETWTKALIDAEIIEMDPSFTAPPFWTGM